MARVALAFVVAGALVSIGAAEPPSGGRCELTLTSTHTGESLHVRYCVAGRHDPDALASLEHLLRDFRNGRQHPIDTGLYDLLSEVAARAGAEPHFEVISGYRSRETNDMLRRRGSGVSERSLHLEGRAIDVRLRGVPTSRLREIALTLKRGGVGYYPKSDFVHLDTGRVRQWSG
jgi:uncharacterized protein YcbK (DUF882 family)